MELFNWICLFHAISSGSCYWVSYSNNKCYWISEVESDFTTAENSCESMNSSLLATETLTEFQYICNQIKDTLTSEYWVGLYKINTAYEWKTGTSPVTSMWVTGEPNNSGNCVRLKPLMGEGEHKLADHMCTQTYRHICEKDIPGSIFTTITHKSSALSANQCPFENYANTGIIKCAKLCYKNYLCTTFGIQMTTKACWLYSLKQTCSVNLPSVNLFYRLNRCG
ncbi:hypothetical protein SNE40_003264 [Patella caerulea]|uniref:C-type lectin domain-containing protein n=1 Tax=Patella caerulea TaxID=87958 RepID=A0AAN8K9E1_PATCE